MRNTNLKVSRILCNRVLKPYVHFLCTTVKNMLKPISDYFLVFIAKKKKICQENIKQWINHGLLGKSYFL